MSISAPSSQRSPKDKRRHHVDGDPYDGGWKNRTNGWGVQLLQISIKLAPSDSTYTTAQVIDNELILCSDWLSLPERSLVPTLRRSVRFWNEWNTFLLPMAFSLILYFRIWDDPCGFETSETNTFFFNGIFIYGGLFKVAFTWVWAWQ